jgi:hypothetical protein
MVHSHSRLARESGPTAVTSAPAAATGGPGGRGGDDQDEHDEADAAAPGNEKSQARCQGRAEAVSMSGLRPEPEVGLAGWEHGADYIGIRYIVKRCKGQ